MSMPARYELEAMDPIQLANFIRSAQYGAFSERAAKFIAELSCSGRDFMRSSHEQLAVIADDNYEFLLFLLALQGKDVQTSPNLWRRRLPKANEIFSPTTSTSSQTASLITPVTPYRPVNDSFTSVHEDRKWGEDAEPGSSGFYQHNVDSTYTMQFPDDHFNLPPTSQVYTIQEEGVDFFSYDGDTSTSGSSESSSQIDEAEEIVGSLSSSLSLAVNAPYIMSTSSHVLSAVSLGKCRVSSNQLESTPTLLADQMSIPGGFPEDRDGRLSRRKYGDFPDTEDPPLSRNAGSFHLEQSSNRTDDGEHSDADSILSRITLRTDTPHLADDEESLLGTRGDDGYPDRENPSDDDIYTDDENEYSAGSSKIPQATNQTPGMVNESSSSKHVQANPHDSEARMDANISVDSGTPSSKHDMTSSRLTVGISAERGCKQQPKLRNDKPAVFVDTRTVETLEVGVQASAEEGKESIPSADAADTCRSPSSGENSGSHCPRLAQNNDSLKTTPSGSSSESEEWDLVLFLPKAQHDLPSSVEKLRPLINESRLEEAGIHDNFASGEDSSREEGRPVSLLRRLELSSVDPSLADITDQLERGWSFVPDQRSRTDGIPSSSDDKNDMPRIHRRVASAPQPDRTIFPIEHDVVMTAELSASRRVGKARRVTITNSERIDGQTQTEPIRSDLEAKQLRRRVRQQEREIAHLKQSMSQATHVRGKKMSFFTRWFGGDSSIVENDQDFNAHFARHATTIGRPEALRYV